jgi:hypothetical protein
MLSEVVVAGTDGEMKPGHPASPMGATLGCEISRRMQVAKRRSW